MCDWIKTGKESTKMMPALIGWWCLGFLLPNFAIMVSKPAMLMKQFQVSRQTAFADS